MTTPNKSHETALLLLELAGESVPVTPRAREAWVRYGLREAMDRSAIYEAVAQAHPDENTGVHPERLYRRTSDLEHLQGLTFNRDEILRHVHAGGPANLTVLQGRDHREFLMMFGAFRGSLNRIELSVHQFPDGHLVLHSMEYTGGINAVYMRELFDGSFAFEELHHLMAPLIRRALEFAPKAFALLEEAQ